MRDGMGNKKGWGEMGNNPKLFREMSEPFESSEAAGEAIGQFFYDLEELRAKHKMANVYAIVNGSFVTETGESEFVVPMQLGDEMRGETLTAYAFGFEAERSKERLAKMQAEGRNRGRKTAAEKGQ